MVPMTEIVYPLDATDVVVLTVIVLKLPAEMVVGKKLAVAPDGNPLALSVIDPLKPFRGVAVMV